MNDETSVYSFEGQNVCTFIIVLCVFTHVNDIINKLFRYI